MLEASLPPPAGEGPQHGRGDVTVGVGGEGGCAGGGGHQQQLRLPKLRHKSSCQERQSQKHTYDCLDPPHHKERGQ